MGSWMPTIVVARCEIPGTRYIRTKANQTPAYRVPEHHTPTKKMITVLSKIKKQKSKGLVRRDRIQLTEEHVWSCWEADYHCTDEAARRGQTHIFFYHKYHKYYRDKGGKNDKTKRKEWSKAKKQEYRTEGVDRNEASCLPKSRAGDLATQSAIFFLLSSTAVSSVSTATAVHTLLNKSTKTKHNFKY